jgi:hypothetical protein
MFRVIIFAVLLALIALYAVIRGGTPERMVAGGYLGAYAGSAFFASDRLLTYQTLEIGVLFIDIALAGFLLSITLFANRYWTIWAASAQMVGLFAHFAKLVIPEIAAPAYGLTLIFWSYLSLPILFMGTKRHHQRKRRFGSDASWSVSH